MASTDRLRVRPPTIGEWLPLSAALYPSGRCFVDEGLGRTLTFGEVNARVNRLANGLRGGGVRRADRLAILAVDSHCYMETLLASMKLGTTYVPLNYRLALSELVTLLEESGATWLFVSPQYETLASDLLAKVGPLERVVVYRPAHQPAPASAQNAQSAPIDYEAFLASSDESEPPCEVAEDDILGLAFTSGTTGRPKGVLQSHRMMKMMVTNGMVHLNTTADEFRYSAAPMFHIGGMAMAMHGIALGFPNLLMAQFDPAAMLRWLQGGEITSVFLVPTMINRLLAMPGVDGHDYSNLKSVVYGGGPITPMLLRRALDVFNCDFIQTFAAGTEAGGQTVLTAGDHRRAGHGEPHLLASIGRPAFGVALRLVDDELHDVEPGQVGEIATRSETVMSGYLGQPEESAAALRGGWFRAGDMAWADARGYLYLAGRKNDMIVRGGENVYPIEIETVLADFPGVRDVAVIGLPSEEWGESVCAVLALEPGGESPTAEELRRHCRHRLAAYKVPTRFEFASELPVNASGKVLKTELRRALG
jgi:acyl-CoA synthetase (AMP-forming)/AMP-acid ligase II